MNRRDRVVVTLLIGVTAATIGLALALAAYDGARRGPNGDLPPAHWPEVQAALAGAWAVPGGVLAWRRRELPFGLLALAAAAAHAAAALAVAASPDGRWSLWAASWLILVELPIIGAVVQIFPTGHPVPGWRWLLGTTLAAGGLGVALTALAEGAVDVDVSGSIPTNPLGMLPTNAIDAAVPLLAVSALAGIVPLVVRYRRSVAPERRAVGWVLAVMATALVIPIVVVAGGEWGEAGAQAFTAAQLTFMGYVVLRYRVWGMAPMLRRSLQRVVAARDAERSRLRAELHDSIGAGLTSIRLKVDAASQLIGDRPDRAGEVLGSASADIGTLVDEVRRLVDDLRPAVLEHADLVTAIRSRADELSTHTDLTITVDAYEVRGRLPPVTENAAYRVTTEALNNVVRHARATRCHVRLVSGLDELVVEVTDDGIGKAAATGGGIGLASMSRRVEELGGYLTTRSTRHGGFALRAVIPASETPAADPSEVAR